MRDYREKDVEGIVCYIFNNDRPKITRSTVTVRMTSDKIGQSLSLSAYNIMISIPLEQVRDIIQVSERSKK